jgi:GxxExxY protein
MSTKAAPGQDRQRIDSIARDIVDCAIRVHSELGAGLLESTYEACLRFELSQRGHEVRGQLGLPVVYRGNKLELGYRIDLLVDGLVLVEVKSVDAIAPIHKAQVITYLKLSGTRLGLLLNFNVPHMRDGIQRIANGF